MKQNDLNGNIKKGIIYILFLLSSMGMIYSQSRPFRTVTIKIAADQDIQNRWISRMEIQLLK